MQNWHIVEHKIWREQAEIRAILQSKKILLSISGGRDSMVLLNVLRNLAAPLQVELAVAYVHHGIKGTEHLKNDVQENYRNVAKDFVENAAKDLGLPFFCLGPSESKLKSEEDFREFRYEQLNILCNQKGFNLIATGHHSQDLFETRLIRLIRGTGAEGIEAMSLLQANMWRPMLGISTQELCQYAEDKALRYLEDPSNQDLKFMRNWLRNSWLRQLEEYRPGAVQSFARSLENLASLTSGSTVYDFTNGIKWEDFLILTAEQKSQILAQYLHSLGVRGFRQGQIEEILKRLDISQRVHSFKLAQCLWTIDANCVKAERF